MRKSAGATSTSPLACFSARQSIGDNSSSSSASGSADRARPSRRPRCVECPSLHRNRNHRQRSISSARCGASLQRSSPARIPVRGTHARILRVGAHRCRGARAKTSSSSSRALRLLRVPPALSRDKLALGERERARAERLSLAALRQATPDDFAAGVSLASEKPSSSVTTTTGMSLRSRRARSSSPRGARRARARRRRRRSRGARRTLLAILARRRFSGAGRSDGALRPPRWSRGSARSER